MTSNLKEYESAFALFKTQIDCVINDDRKAQMDIYTEDLHYEFPFATDRPKIIEGQDAFRIAMEPIWERRRKNKVRVELGKSEFHSTDEPGLFLAIFELKAVSSTNGESESAPCIQLLRIRDGRIAEVREYFEP